MRSTIIKKNTLIKPIILSKRVETILDDCSFCIISVTLYNTVLSANIVKLNILMLTIVVKMFVGLFSVIVKFNSSI